MTSRRGSAAMAGDACLLSAVSVVLGPLSIVIGPGAAWLLHGRRIDAAALTGWLAGVFAAVLVIGGVLGVAPLVLRTPGAETPGDLATAALLAWSAGAVFAAVALTLAVAAVRDLAPGMREHVRLDIVRLVAVGVLAAGAVVVLQVQRVSPGSEIGSAAIFALAAGAAGALTTWVAAVVAAAMARRGTRAGVAPTS